MTVLLWKDCASISNSSRLAYMIWIFWGLWEIFVFLKNASFEKRKITGSMLIFTIYFYFTNKAPRFMYSRICCNFYWIWLKEMYLFRKWERTIWGIKRNSQPWLSTIKLGFLLLSNLSCWKIVASSPSLLIYPSQTINNQTTNIAVRDLQIVTR